MFTSAKLNGPPAAPSFYMDTRAERLFHEHRKLANSAKSYIYAHPSLVGLGDDPIVVHLTAAAGFTAVDLVIFRLAAKGRLITAVTVPTRLWRDADVRERLLDIKREARELHISCILVPQRWVRAEVRGSVARSIAQARQATYTHRELHCVLDHLRTVKISTLAETAGIMTGHKDPFGAVLAMVAQGYVVLDRSSPLRPDTWMSIGH